MTEEVEVEYNTIGSECIAIRCHRVATHIVTMKVDWQDGSTPMTAESAYCLDDALYFAAWLPYCYPGKQELVSIMPPASELFENKK